MRVPAIDLVSSLLGETHPITQSLRWLAKMVETASTIKGADVTIVWRPDGKGDVTTWAGVMTLVALAMLRSAPVKVWCPQFSPENAPVYQIPAGTYAFPKGSIIEGIAGDPQRCAVNCADGVQMVDLIGVAGGLELVVNNTALPFLAFSADYAGFIPVWEFRVGGSIRHMGTAPIYTIPPMEVFAFGMLLGGYYQSPVQAPFVAMSPNTFMVGTFVAAARLDINAITGGALTNWVVQHTGCVPTFDTSVVFPNFLGTIQNVALNQDGGSGPATREPSNVFGDVHKGTHYMNDTVGTERVFWGETDPLDWRKVVGQTFISGAFQLNDLDAGTHVLPAGFGTTSFGGPGRAPMTCAAKQNLTTMYFRIRAGNPPNAGLTVTARLFINGVGIPATDITLPADSATPQVGSSTFIQLANIGDELEVGIITPDLPNDIFDLTSTLI